jgi:hypothetical protein
MHASDWRTNSAQRAEILAQWQVKATVNPADVASGALVSGTVAMPHALAGCDIRAIPGVVLAAGMFVTASVSAAGTITWSIFNISGGNIDVASSTWTFIITRYAK